MKVFLDTSFLLKLYHQEEGSEVAEDILSKGIEEIFLSELAILEFCSAFWKKVREGELDEKVATEVIAYFQNDYDKFQWIPLQSALIESAEDLLMKYGKRGLRTLDSLQLASALTLKSNNCIFLTSDVLLKSLMTEENLKVV